MDEQNFPKINVASEEEERAFIRSIINSSAAAITVLNNRGEIVFANQMARSILGVSASEVEGRTYDSPAWQHESVDGGPFPHDDQPFVQVMRTKKPVYDIRHVIKWPDGKKKILSINGDPIFDNDGEIQYITFQVADVTIEHEAKKVFQDREKLLRNIFDQAPVIIWTSDMEGNIDFVNQACLDFTGGAVDAFLGQKWRDFIHPDHRDLAILPKDKGAEHDLSVESEILVKSKRGDYEWFVVRQCLRRNSVGDAEGVIGCLANIDSLKKAREKEQRLYTRITESQKLESMEVLAAGVAHDFNNIITAISGSAELATFDVDDSEAVVDSLAMIMDACEKATSLCHQMMLYSGVNKDFQDEKLAVSELITGTRSLIHSIIKKKTRFVVEPFDEDLCLYADRGKFQQVLLNLIINANDAVKDSSNPEIRLKVESHDPQDIERLADEELSFFAKPNKPAVGITLVDNGCGMKESTARRLFEPFFTTKSDGKGLGMASVLGIIRQSNGGYYIQTTEGEGTAITVFFLKG